jgi:hypothetical protein
VHWVNHGADAAAVGAAIEDLQGREAQLLKREQRAAAVDRALTDLAATL